MIRSGVLHPDRRGADCVLARRVSVSFEWRSPVARVAISCRMHDSLVLTQHCHCAKPRRLGWRGVLTISCRLRETKFQIDETLARSKHNRMLATMLKVTDRKCVWFDQQFEMHPKFSIRQSSWSSGPISTKPSPGSLVTAHATGRHAGMSSSGTCQLSLRESGSSLLSQDNISIPIPGKISFPLCTICRLGFSASRLCLHPYLSSK